MNLQKFRKNPELFVDTYIYNLTENNEEGEKKESVAKVLLQWLTLKKKFGGESFTEHLEGDNFE